MLITNVLMKLDSLASGFMMLLLISELIAFLVPPSNGRTKWFILLTYRLKIKRDVIETITLILVRLPISGDTPETPNHNLRNGELVPLYIPSRQSQEDRSLVRIRIGQQTDQM